MASKYPTEEDVNKFLKANQDLLNLGITFSHNIDSAFLEFKKILELMIKSNFVERAVVEMLADSFDKLEKDIKGKHQLLPPGMRPFEKLDFFVKILGTEQRLFLLLHKRFFKKGSI